MKLAKFVPQPDITTYELARVLQLIIAGFNHDVGEPALKFLGKESSAFTTFIADYADVQRHFEISEEEHDRLWR